MPDSCAPSLYEMSDTSPSDHVTVSISDLPPATREYLEHSTDIHRTRSALELAYVRCLTIDELLQRIEEKPLIPWYYRKRLLLFRIEEMGVSIETARRLATLADSVDLDTQRLKSKDRKRADSLLKRLCQLLPPELGVPRLLSYLSNPRAERRTVGVQGLRDRGLDEAQLITVLDAYNTTLDTQILSVAATNSTHLPIGVAITTVLPHLSDARLRSLVVADLIQSAESIDLVALARQYPTAFLAATARLGRSDLVHLTDQYIETLGTSWEQHSLIAWSYGKLGDRNRIDRLAEMIGKQDAWQVMTSCYQPIESAP